MFVPIRFEEKTAKEENGKDKPAGTAPVGGGLFSVLPTFDMGLFGGQSALKPAEKPKTDKPLSPVPKESKPPAGREF